MFPGIQSIHEICPGIILRCDCLSSEMDKTILSPEEWHARWASGTRPTADPKPCLVIEVDYDAEFVKVARLCDAAPRDCRKWVRIDSAPEIEWCHPYSWIWVGSPATMRLVKNRSRIMHINQDPRFNQDPISSRNLRHYLVHRENYESWRRFQAQTQSSPEPSPFSAAYGTNLGPYTTLHVQPVVVPAGFTEQHPMHPGLYRNPGTGWFWSAERGLIHPK
ncbi:unnamed protein product [Mycena citricolor]|uniref:Uncharacterized protein n=1 Tax=Mycena citricolor TaxID=2018698 RepID=A0AAD2Q5R1_9AGAR|nr:unnamed protein product [Mycena citricolor]